VLELRFNKDLYKECLNKYKQKWSIDNLKEIDNTIDQSEKKGINGTDKIDKARINLTSKMALTVGKMMIFKSLKDSVKHKSCKKMVLLKLKSLSIKHYTQNQDMNNAMETQKGAYIDSMLDIIEEVMIDENDRG